MRRILPRWASERYVTFSRNYPRRYVDLSNVETAARAPIGQFVTVTGTVDEVVEKQPRRRLHILEVSIFDGTGIIMATWFRQPLDEREVRARHARGLFR